MANIYLTESGLLLDDKIKRLLQQDGRKEKILQVFFTKGETITYDQVETIALAGQKMQVNTLEIASKDDMLIRLGYLMGSTRKSNDTVYAFFEDGAIIQFLKNYGIEALDDALHEKKRSSAGRKKKSTEETQQTGKEEPDDVKPKDNESGCDQNEEKKTSDSEAPFVKEKTENKVPSISKEGSDRQVFMSIMGVSCKDINYQGSQEQLALDIADCMQEVEVHQANFKQELCKKFGDENGQKVYELVNPNYVYLRGSLACVSNS